MNGDAYTLIGVLPPNFNFAGQDIEVWTPLIFRSKGELESNKMAVLGRLKPSVTLKQANREMEVISKSLISQFPDYKDWSAMVNSLADLMEVQVRPALTAFLVGVGLVLLIACTNVANLMLARSDVRYKEVAIRSAMGASRGRLIRQFLTETMLLAFAGGLAGLALAWAGLRVLVTVAAGQLPRIEGVSLDARVLGFTFVVTIAHRTALRPLARRVNCWVGTCNSRCANPDADPSIAAAAAPSRNVLVVSEIGLSLMLAIGRDVDGAQRAVAPE